MKLAPAFFSEAQQLDQHSILSSMCTINQRCIEQSKPRWRADIHLVSGSRISADPIKAVSNTEMLFIDSQQGSLIYLKTAQISSIEIPANQDLMMLIRGKVAPPKAGEMPTNLKTKRLLAEIGESLSPTMQLVFGGHESLSDELKGQFLFNVTTYANELSSVFSNLNSDELGKQALASLKTISFQASNSSRPEAKTEGETLMIMVPSETLASDSKDLLLDLISQSL